MAVQCGNCKTSLTTQERRDGWCETCGKKLPPSLRLAAGRRWPGYAPTVRGVPADESQPGRTWPLFLVLAFVCLMGGILCLGSYSKGGEMPEPTDGRGRLVYAVLGPETTTVLCLVVAFGGAAVFGAAGYWQWLVGERREKNRGNGWPTS